MPWHAGVATALSASACIDETSPLRGAVWPVCCLGAAHDKAGVLQPPHPPQSFSKNMGLYGERVGCLTFITNDAAAAKGALDLLHDVSACLGRQVVSLEVDIMMISHTSRQQRRAGWMWQLVAKQNWDEGATVQLQLAKRGCLPHASPCHTGGTFHVHQPSHPWRSDCNGHPWGPRAAGAVGGARGSHAWLGHEQLPGMQHWCCVLSWHQLPYLEAWCTLPARQPACPWYACLPSTPARSASCRPWPMQWRRGGTPCTLRWWRWARPAAGTTSRRSAACLASWGSRG